MTTATDLLNLGAMQKPMEDFALALKTACVRETERRKEAWAQKARVQGWWIVAFRYRGHSYKEIRQACGLSKAGVRHFELKVLKEAHDDSDP